MFAPEDVLRQSDEHSETGGGEAEMPVDLLSEEAADQRRGHRADVDAHVKQREAGIAARVVRLVKKADHRAYVRLEHARAEDDESESEEEGRERGDGHREMAERDQHPTEKYRPVVADDAVGEPAAGNRRRVNRHRVEAVDRGRAARGESESAAGDRRDHEEDEESAHAVVAEALPHFCEEKRRETARVAEHARTVRVARSDVMFDVT